MSMTMSVETIKYKGYTINIEYDDEPECPTEWGGYKIVTFGLGLITDGEALDYFTGARGDKILPSFQAKMRTGKAFAIRYSSHGPQSIYSLGHELTDTASIDGFIIFGDEFAKNFNDYDSRQEMAKGELETYADWANGSVYGFQITNPYGEDMEDGDLWGIYGLEDTIAEAKAAVDSDIKYDRPARHAVNAKELHR